MSSPRHHNDNFIYNLTAPRCATPPCCLRQLFVADHKFLESAACCPLGQAQPAHPKCLVHNSDSADRLAELPLCPAKPRGSQSMLTPGKWQEVGTQTLHEACGALPRAGHAVVVVGKLIYAVGGRYSATR